MILFRKKCILINLKGHIYNSIYRYVKNYGNKIIIKVSGPSIETLCVFLCIKNIINAEMWT